LPKRDETHPPITPQDIEANTWYCLLANVGRDFQVQAMLQASGFMSYVPVRTEWRFGNGANKKKKKKTLKTYPLMAGYVFIGFHPNQIHAGNSVYWSALFNEKRVLGVLGNDGVAKPISKAWLLDFCKEHPNGVQKPKQEQFQRTYAEFGQGDFVAVADGPFTGMEGKVINMRKKGEFAQVEIEIFGGKRVIEFESFSLEKAA